MTSATYHLFAVMRPLSAAVTVPFGARPWQWDSSYPFAWEWWPATFPVLPDAIAKPEQDIGTSPGQRFSKVRRRVSAKRFDHLQVRKFRQPDKSVERQVTIIYVERSDPATAADRLYRAVGKCDCAKVKALDVRRQFRACQRFRRNHVAANGQVYETAKAADNAQAGIRNPAGAGNEKLQISPAGELSDVMVSELRAEGPNAECVIDRCASALEYRGQAGDAFVFGHWTQFLLIRLAGETWGNSRWFGGLFSPVSEVASCGILAGYHSWVKQTGGRAP